jgi:hypothetical protein
MWNKFFLKKSSSKKLSQKDGMRSPINNKVLDVLKTLILPLLLVVFPALFFHGQEVANLLSPSLQRTFLLYSLAGILIFCIFCALTRGQVVKAANVALILLIFFYAYRKVYSYLVRQDIIQVESYTLFPLFLLLAIYASWFVMKGSPPILWDDIAFVKKLKSAKLFRQLADRKVAFIVLVILFPVLLNIVTIIGISKADPVLLLSGLGYKVQPGFLAGRHILDEGVGFSTQPLGYRAALDLLQGHIPWWNPYSGVGLPFAGEMIPAALFPLTLVEVLPEGTLWFHILLEIIAGLGTFFLLRQLGFGRGVALVGALLYEVNGTFSWLANAVVNPVPFLPLMLMGVERARTQAQRCQAGGWIWIAIALALSLYAGFPEMAYLNGLLVVCWILLRLVQGPSKVRAAFFGKVLLGGVGGLFLAAPIIIAFLDFTLVGYLGRHAVTIGKAVSVSAARVAQSLPRLVFPYIWGPFFAFPGTNSLWYTVGGYSGVGLLVVAVIGLFGRHEGALRRLLGAWVAITLCATFGVPIIHTLVTAFPGVSMTVYYRFFPPSWELALCLLVVYAIEDIRKLHWKVLLARLAVGIGVIVAVAVVGLFNFRSAELWHNFWETSGSYRIWFLGSLLIGILVIVGLLVAGRIGIAGRRMAWIAGIVVLEAVVYFAIPIGSRPIDGQLVFGGVRFLQQNLGYQRFYTLDPIHPNYGAYFGIASINYSYNPIPQTWLDYVTQNLDSNLDSPNHFYGRHNALDYPTAADELRNHLANYEAVGVKYVVAISGDNPFLATDGSDVGGAKPEEVYNDEVMTIYELPDPAPYVEADGCKLDVKSRTDIVADCFAPSTLIRLEQYMEGWRAEVNGKPVTVEQHGEIFQQIELPEGQTEVHFTFVPPYMQIGVVLFGVGWVIVGVGLYMGIKGGGGRRIPNPPS